MDKDAVDLRLPQQRTLHAEDEPSEAQRPGRLRRLLQPRETPRAQRDRAVQMLRLRRSAQTGQGEPGHLLAEGRKPGRFRKPASSRRDRRRDRGGPAGRTRSVCSDCRRPEEVRAVLADIVALVVFRNDPKYAVEIPAHLLRIDSGPKVLWNLAKPVISRFRPLLNEFF